MSKRFERIKRACQVKRAEQEEQAKRMAESDDSYDSDFELPPRIKPRAKRRKVVDAEDKRSPYFARKSPDLPQIEFPRDTRSMVRNIVCAVDRRMQGSIGIERYKQDAAQIVKNGLAQFKVKKTYSPFDCRILSMDWHPFCDNLVAYGSKHGDLVLYNVDDGQKDKLLNRGNAGCGIAAMKFDRNNPSYVYTATQDSYVAKQDFENNHYQIFDTAVNMRDWFTSLDFEPHKKLVIAGENSGQVHLMSDSGAACWVQRLHRQKVSHLEFSTRDQSLLVSASVDSTIKLWDLRMMQDPLVTIPHSKPINSAYFSLLDGTRLLATDQLNHLYIYRHPNWVLERTLFHPHRQFQHLTAIRAAWHPSADLVVVGRYPNPKMPGYDSSECRTVDIFNAGTGEMVTQLHHAKNGIVSLNKFNQSGTAMGSAMGYTVLIWKEGRVLERKVREGSQLMSSDDDEEDQEVVPKAKKKSAKQKRAELLKVDCKSC